MLIAVAPAGSGDVVHAAWLQPVDAAVNPLLAQNVH